MITWRRAVVLVAGLLVAGCAQPGGPPPADGTGTWRELPPPPLSPRQMAVTAWTGAEALFIGGDVGPPCDTPEAVCDRMPVPAADGAAYDPATNTWRSIAEAPVPVGLWPGTAVVGQVVFVLAQDPADGGPEPALLGYDAAADTWTTLEAPPGGLASVSLFAAGDRLLAARGERHAGDPPDQLYDPATRTWTPLPEDPLGPGFDRGYVRTPAGLVLTAKELVPNPGAQPAFVRAAVLDPATMTWRRLPDSEQVGGYRWTWTGTRLVDATLGEVDGGEVNNYGRSYPLGGVLDPNAGEWGPLPGDPDLLVPDWPANAPGWWPVDAVGGRFTATQGLLYDDHARSWRGIPRPDGGPTRPGSAVWAGEVLVVFGGIDDEGEEDGTLSAETWLYEPASGEDPPVVSEGIVGDWELVDGTLDGEPFPFPQAGRGTLSADDRRIGGTAFCNGYGSPYRLDGDRLRLDELGQTLMACVDGDRMAAEAAFMGVLGAEGTRFTRTAESLTLENDRGSLVFRPQTPVPTADLVGTRWVLDTLVDGEVASSTVGEPAVLQLADDGTFTAGTGCRTLSGRWQASGDTVTLDYGWAGPACPPDVDAQEQHVIAVLGNGFRAEVDSDRLTVSSSNGPGLVYRAG